MDYELTMNSINEIAEQAANLYQGLKNKIDQNHVTFIDPTLQDQRDTQEVASRLSNLYDQAQQILDDGVKEKRQQIDNRYHSNVTADQLAEVNQLNQYDNLSEDELEGYLDKYKDNAPLLKAFEAVIKSQGWSIDGLTYDNEISMLKYFNSTMQTVVDGIKDGKPAETRPLESKISYSLLAERIKSWNEKVNNSTYTLKRDK